MLNAYELRSKIDGFLEVLALNRVDRFYPTALSKFLGITPGEAFDYLSKRTGIGDQLTLMWEVRCPECYRTIDLLQIRKTDEYDCRCGEELEINENSLYPVFKLNNDYKKFIIDENQKKRKEIRTG